jgi:putative mRNA 3-end processing factor
MITIRQKGSHGFILPRYDIGLDSSGKEASYTFISHAHADHMPYSAEAVYATPATAKLMKARKFKGNVNTLDFGVPFNTPNARVTFYPAGHILGSAMTFVETDEGNLLYTGDFRYPASPTSEGFNIPDTVDLLITEATFSLPIYRWAEHEVLFEEIRTFASKSLSNGHTPIFLAYSLGKTQEVMHALVTLNRPVLVHSSAFPLCQIYNDMGVDLGNYSKYDQETVQNTILVTPTQGLRNGMLASIKKPKIAYVSGWAALESRRMQMNIDKRIPLSDHIDFFELIDLCEHLKPKKVLVTHTPNPDIVCHYLKSRAISASPIESIITHA